MELRPFVLKALEEQRRGGLIGSSLEARVIFETASDRDYAYLNSHSDIIHTVFIVSQVEIKRVEVVGQPINEQYSKTSITVEKALGEKCSRCWNYKTDVGSVGEHPLLCASCAKVVKEMLL
jgi:isoleucyl-tRNA synthetase